jgi:hypothetical protein
MNDHRLEKIMQASIPKWFPPARTPAYHVTVLNQCLIHESQTSRLDGKTLKTSSRILSQERFVKSTSTELACRQVLVARERFELSSAAPEAAMFDHCTTGLRFT